MTDALTRPASVIYPDSDGLPMTESDPTRDYLLYCVATLEAFFKGRPNVYVSGNLFIYYEEGNNTKAISPDVFVIFGVRKHKRRSYQAWREGGKFPSFVLEITSRSTKNQDEVEKPLKYAELGVEEYFQYDPTGDYLKPQLKGRRLVEGHYQLLTLQTRNGMSYLHSDTLGLDLCLQEPNWLETVPFAPLTPTVRSLRFFDPQTQSWLLSYDELGQSRLKAEQEKVQAEQEKAQVEQEKAQVEQQLDQAQQSLRQAAARFVAMGLSQEEIAQVLGISVDDLTD